MVSEDINDGIIRLENTRVSIISLVNSLNKAKDEQKDMSADFDALINKLQAKLVRVDKQLKEFCDYAVEIAMTEAEVYENMYMSENDPEMDINSYLFM